MSWSELDRHGPYSMADIIPRVLADIERRRDERASGEIRVGEWRYIIRERAIVHDRAGWDICLCTVRCDRDILNWMDHLMDKTWLGDQGLADFVKLCSRISLLRHGADSEEVASARNQQYTGGIEI